MKFTQPKLPQQLTLTAGALAVSFMLAACGGGGSASAPDTTLPTMTVTSNAPATGATGSVTYTINASEAVTFYAANINVMGGTKGAFTTVSPTQATIVVTPTANSAGSMSVSFGAGVAVDASGNTSAVNTAAAAPVAFNTIPAGSGNTGACATSATVNCFNFDEAALAYEAFEGLDSAAQANDPVNAANKVGKIIKVPGGQPWAGATIYTVVSNKSIPIAGLATNKTVTLRVYSPAAGIPMALKFEDASDPTKYVTKSVLSTKANDWETLTFDFSTTLAEGTFNSNTTYNKVSFFPNFQVPESAPRTYYIDELKYTIGTAPAVAPLVFASNYTTNGSSQGGAIGQYADTSKVSDPWFGAAASEFYFGFHMKLATPAGYMGGFVKAPNNGTASVSTYNNVAIRLGGNPELFSRNPSLVAILISTPIPNPADPANPCEPKIKATIAVSSTSLTEYILPKADFTIENACGALNSVASIWSAGVQQVHVQVPANQMQYAALDATNPATGYPNGLNIGTVTFQ